MVKVMNSNREGGQVFWFARTKGCPEPFNWSIIFNLLSEVGGSLLRHKMVKVDGR